MVDPYTFLLVAARRGERRSEAQRQFGDERDDGACLLFLACPFLTRGLDEDARWGEAIDGPALKVGTIGLGRLVEDNLGLRGCY